MGEPPEEKERVIKEGFHFRRGERYHISEALTPEAFVKVKRSEHPKETLCELLGITGEFPGPSDGLWVQQELEMVKYGCMVGDIMFDADRVESVLYLQWKPHTGWY